MRAVIWRETSQPALPSVQLKPEGRGRCGPTDMAVYTLQLTRTKWPLRRATRQRGSGTGGVRKGEGGTRHPTLQPATRAPEARQHNHPPRRGPLKPPLAAGHSGAREAGEGTPSAKRHPHSGDLTSTDRRAPRPPRRRSLLALGVAAEWAERAKPAKRAKQSGCRPIFRLGAASVKPSTRAAPCTKSNCKLRSAAAFCRAKQGGVANGAGPRVRGTAGR